MVSRPLSDAPLHLTLPLLCFAIACIAVALPRWAYTMPLLQAPSLYNLHREMAMGIPTQLKPLVQSDNLHELTGIKSRGFIHNDHRWVLPILAWAQTAGLLTRPSPLVLFDYHTDFAHALLCDTEAGRKLAADFNITPTVEIALEVCTTYLDINDGDWVSGGMELGIISDAIVFGAELANGADTRDGQEYTDLQKRPHSFWSLPLPVDSLDHQGVLADRYHTPKGLWQSLGWSPDRGFKAATHDLILDFDLDVFAFHHKLGPEFAWPDKIFCHQFHQPSIASSAVNGLTGASFISQLITRSPIFNIAREPSYCGGEEECEIIFSRMNKHVFGNRLSKI